MTRSALVRIVLSGTLGVLVAAAPVGLPAPPAQAHAGLLRTSPADGSTVSVAPTEVRLSFDGPIKQRYTRVLVTGPDQGGYADGAARVIDNEVVQAVVPLPAGRIQVAWQTVAADGAAMQGSLTFTTTAAGPGWSRVSDAVASATSGARSSAEPAGNGGGVGNWWWVLPAAALALLALGGTAVRRRRQG